MGLMVIGIWNLLVPKSSDSFGFHACEKSVAGSRHYHYSGTDSSNSFLPNAPS